MSSTVFQIAAVVAGPALPATGLTRKWAHFGPYAMSDISPGMHTKAEVRRPSQFMDSRSGMAATPVPRLAGNPPPNYRGGNKSNWEKW
jgi:hypothetical protein